MNYRPYYWTLFVIVACFAPFADAASDNDRQIPFKVTTPQPRDEFYFKIDSGAVFFRPPDKDNGNFSEADAGTLTDGVNSLNSQSGNDITWKIGGTIGFYLPVHPTEPWLGKNIRLEASGDYFQTSHTDSADLSVQPGVGSFITIGRLDGNYTGTNQSTDIGSIVAGPNPVASETLDIRDEFYQAGIALRTDYLFDRGLIVLSPKLGFNWSHLNQTFDTSAEGNRGSVTQNETIDTDYFGPKFALELKAQLSKSLVCYAEGELSPFYATSDYSGSQFGYSSHFGGGSLQNSATDSQDTFSFKAGVTAGLYYDLGFVIFKLGGGFEYWDYVATVQEAAIPPETSTVGFAPGPFTIQPSHLSSSTMLNPMVNADVIFPF